MYMDALAHGEIRDESDSYTDHLNAPSTGHRSFQQSAVAQKIDAEKNGMNRRFSEVFNGERSKLREIFEFLCKKLLLIWIRLHCQVDHLRRHWPLPIRQETWFFHLAQSQPRSPDLRVPMTQA